MRGKVRGVGGGVDEGVGGWMGVGSDGERVGGDGATVRIGSGGRWRGDHDNRAGGGEGGRRESVGVGMRRG